MAALPKHTSFRATGVKNYTTFQPTIVPPVASYGDSQAAAAAAGMATEGVGNRTVTPYALCGGDRGPTMVRRRMAAESGQTSALDGRGPSSTDYANYFSTYAYLYHQVHDALMKDGACLTLGMPQCRLHSSAVRGKC